MNRKIRYKTIIIIIVFTAICFLTGCDFFNNNTVSTVKGNLSITIPQVNPVLLNNKSTESTGTQDTYRTFIFVSYIEFKLYEGASLIDEWTAYGNKESFTHLVTPGSGYTIYADIYNTYVSLTSPVVSGSATGIDVTAGGFTGVSITCLPNSYITLAESALDSGTLIPGIRDPGAVEWKSITEIGAEKYFMITPTTDLTLIELTPGAGNAAAFIVWNSSGDMEYSAYNLKLGDRISGYFDTNPTDTYYVGIALFNWTNHTPDSYTFTYSPFAYPADDPYEPNDEESEAYNLSSKNTLLSEGPGYGIASDSDGGDYFHITVDSSGGYRISVNCTLVSTFHNGEGGCTFKIRMYNGLDYEDIASTEVNETGTKKLFVQIVTPGDYYIRVGNNTSGNITEYDLEWTTEPGVEAWGGTTYLEGSTSYITPVNVPLMEHWYSGITADPVDFMFYSVNVTPGKTYDIYFDCGNKLNWGISPITNGTGIYTARLYIHTWAYSSGENVWYYLESTYNGCYFTPITITPTQPVILIRVDDPVSADETFAFGIEEH